MAIIYRPRRYGSDIPRIGAKVNPSHAIAQGLVAAWLVNEGGGVTLYSALDTRGLPANNATIVNGTNWIGDRNYFANSSSQYASSNVTIPLTGAFSFFVNYIPQGPSGSSYGRIIETSYTDGLFFGNDVSGSSYLFIARSSSAIGSQAGTVVVGKKLAAAGIFDGTSTFLYLDGALAASNATTVDAAAAARAIFLSTNATSPGTVQSDGIIGPVYIWNRAISPAEIQELTANPYAFIEPRAPELRYFIPTIAGGGTVNLTVTTGDSLNNWSDAAARAILYSVNASDTLNLWNDARSFFSAYTFSNGDDFNLWTDSVTTLGQGLLNVSDTLNNWSDLATASIIYSLNLTDSLNQWLDSSTRTLDSYLDISDSLNQWNDSLGTFSAWTLGIGDDLNQWNDSLGGTFPYGLTIGDNLNQWLDFVSGGATSSTGINVGDDLNFWLDSTILALVEGPPPPTGNVFQSNYLRRYLNDINNPGAGILTYVASSGHADASELSYLRRYLNDIR